MRQDRWKLAQCGLRVGVTLLGNRIEHLTVLNEEARHDDRRAEVHRVGVGVDPISNLIEYRLLVVSVLGRLVVKSATCPAIASNLLRPLTPSRAELLLDDAIPLQDMNLDPLGELKILA